MEFCFVKPTSSIHQIWRKAAYEPKTSQLQYDTFTSLTYVHPYFQVKQAQGPPHDNVMRSGFKVIVQPIFPFQLVDKLSTFERVFQQNDYVCMKENDSLSSI